MQRINEPGQVVDIEDSVVMGKVTVFDFYAEWCEPCRDLEQRILKVAEVEPRLAVRKVDIADQSSPVARAYSVNIIPHIRVFDTTGEMRYLLIGRNARNTPMIVTKLLDEASVSP